MHLVSKQMLPALAVYLVSELQGMFELYMDWWSL
jgi:hypothetical protein